MVSNPLNNAIAGDVASSMIPFEIASSAGEGALTSSRCNTLLESTKYTTEPRIAGDVPTSTPTATSSTTECDAISMSTMCDVSPANTVPPAPEYNAGVHGVQGKETLNCTLHAVEPILVSKA